MILGSGYRVQGTGILDYELWIMGEAMTGRLYDGKMGRLEDGMKFWDCAICGKNAGFWILVAVFLTSDF